MAKTLISTSTASASATLDITSGIDSTYSVYEFHFVNMHPASDNVHFVFQANASGGSGFNETMTTTAFDQWNSESGSSGNMSYGLDQAQGTVYQHVAISVGHDADDNGAGILTLYAPSSTTYVKHFTARFHTKYWTVYTYTTHTAGYINTTSAIDEISFKMSSGNMDAGVIKMFGVS